jgi:hypothetical protein
MSHEPACEHEWQIVAETLQQKCSKCSKLRDKPSEDQFWKEIPHYNDFLFEVPAASLKDEPLQSLLRDAHADLARWEGTVSGHRKALAKAEQSYERARHQVEAILNELSRRGISRISAAPQHLDDARPTLLPVPNSDDPHNGDWRGKPLRVLGEPEVFE